MLLIKSLLLGFGLFLVYKLYQRWRVRAILGRIPAPPGLWPFGNLNILLMDPSPEGVFGFLREFSEKYRPIFRLHTPFFVMIMFLHPKDYETILSQPKHIEKSYIYNFLQDWLGTGLLTSFGLKWQRRRKVLTKAFHFNILQQFLKVFNDETAHLIERIEKLNEEGEEFINVTKLVTRLTLQSMMDTSMGTKDIDPSILHTYRENIYKMGHLILQRVLKPWLNFPMVYSLTQRGREQKKIIKQLHDFTYKVIRQRERRILEEDAEGKTISYSGRKFRKMLDILLYEKIYENGIDYEGIREEVDTFMFEGHDTTASAITFLLLSLAEYPHFQEEVRKEIYEVLGPTNTPTYQDLQNLPYTEMFIKETLRLYPSVPFISRTASEDFTTFSGHKIVKGTIMHLLIYDLHRDPEIYPDPLKFDPDRFLPENCNKRHPFAFVPFSAGPRNCIGQKFAMLEIKAALCGILRQFKLEYDPDTDKTFVTDLILHTKNDIKVKFVPLSKN